MLLPPLLLSADPCICRVSTCIDTQDSPPVIPTRVLVRDKAYQTTNQDAIQSLFTPKVTIILI